MSHFTFNSQCNELKVVVAMGYNMTNFTGCENLSCSSNIACIKHGCVLFSLNSFT